MKSLREVWAWDGIDYLIQFALICVFAFCVMYASGANQTLTDSGCKAYWQEYNPEVDLESKILVNKTEADRLKRGGPTELDFSPENKSLNFSKYSKHK